MPIVIMKYIFSYIIKWSNPYSRLVLWTLNSFVLNMLVLFILFAINEYFYALNLAK